MGKERSTTRTPAAETGPFASAVDCLEAWFHVLGPMTGASDRHPTGVVPIEERLPFLQRLAARTKATRRAGIAVPVLDAIEALGLDLLDRLLLLALLRDALDARSSGGRRSAALCDAAGAAALLDRVSSDPTERCTVWSYPDPAGPGWDAAARCRWGLGGLAEAYVSTDGPASGDPFAFALREAGATAVHEAALLLLLLSRGEDEPPLSWALLEPALASPAASFPGASSPLVAAGLVEVRPSKGSPQLWTCCASAAARLRAVPSGLPVLRPARPAGATETATNPDLVEKIDPRLKLDGVVLPRATRLRIAEALAVPAALASLAGTDWGVEECLLGEPNVALLLYGPPGTGKTLCAEAIAGQLGRTLWRLRTDQLLSKFVGETEKHLTEVFAEAPKKGDVVLLDEADSFLSTREEAVRSWEATMTNVLLQEIERFRGVVVLTTNRDAVLDPALERRLAARIGFQLPNASERQLLWLKHLPPRGPLRALGLAHPHGGALRRRPRGLPRGGGARPRAGRPRGVRRRADRPQRLPPDRRRLRSRGGRPPDARPRRGAPRRRTKGEPVSDYPDLVDDPEEIDAEPAPEAPAAAPELTDVKPYLDFLVAEGFRPEVDEDGDIRFRHEGRTLFLFRDARDPQYFRVALPGAWECDSPEEETRALAAVNAVNRDLKVVKCVLVDGAVWISIEQFLDPPETFRPVFFRLLDIIGSAAWQVKGLMRAPV